MFVFQKMKMVAPDISRVKYSAHTFAVVGSVFLCPVAFTKRCSRVVTVLYLLARNELYQPNR